jgi:hypothetical protein
MLLQDYIGNCYEELAELMEKDKIGYGLEYVPWYEANSDFTLFECLNYGIKRGYDL